MSDAPGLVLITPRQFEPAPFADRLARLLDARDVACVRLDLDSTDPGEISRAADALHAVCDARDIALIATDHYRLAHELGLDGVHLSDHRQLRDARKLLGPDPICGAFCGASRHDGMTAGEIGATYVAFGPLSPSPLGDGAVADEDVFVWWADMIEVPVLAEGGLTRERAQVLAPFIDYFAIGPEIWPESWDADDAKSALDTLLAGI